MIRRLLRALTLVALATVLAVPAASAAGPTKITDTYSGSFDAGAGELCDLAYSQKYSVTDEITIFPDRLEVHSKWALTHTNVGTACTLTENGLTNYTVRDGLERVVGVLWHLRDASGKLVVVHAGQIVYDQGDFHMVKFTPNSGGEWAAVICTALGGNPA